jgi:hypothetical protein
MDKLGEICLDRGVQSIPPFAGEGLMDVISDPSQ